MDILREKFKLINKLRHCPSFDELIMGGGIVDSHIKKCQECSSLVNNIEALNVLNLLFEGYKLNARKDTASIGDICNIVPPKDFELRTDENGIFYNSPYVVVLNDVDNNGLVKVAQLFNINDFAWDGDVFVADSNEHYAESWNIYGMRLDWLVPIGEKIDEDFIKRILQMERSGISIKINNKIIKMFREDELKTGCFFSYPAVYSSIQHLLDDNDEILVDQSEIRNTKESNYENEFDFVIEESEPIFISAGIRTPTAASSKQKIRCDCSLAINEEDSTLKIDNGEYSVILIQNLSQKTIVLSLSIKSKNETSKCRCLFIGSKESSYRQNLIKRYHSYNKEIYENNWLTSDEVIIPRQSAIRVAVIDDELIDMTSESIEVSYSFISKKKKVK